MKRLWLIGLCIYGSIGQPVESIKLTVDKLAYRAISLQDLHFYLENLSDPQQAIGLSIKALTLPAPIDRLAFLHIRCAKARLEAKALLCQQGKASVKSERFASPKADFRFSLSQSKGAIHIKNIRFAEGSARLHFHYDETAWRLSLAAQRLPLGLLKGLFPKLLKDFSQLEGKVGITAELHGRDKLLTGAQAFVAAEGVNMDSVDGTLASRNLSLKAKIEGERGSDGAWRLKNRFYFLAGEALLKQIFMDFGQHPLELKSTVYWRAKKKPVVIDSMAVKQPGVFEARGNATLSPEAMEIERLDLNLSNIDLALFYPLYIAPFFEETLLDGLALKGYLKARLVVQDNRLIQAFADFKGLALDDTNGRFKLKGGKGSLAWSRAGGAGISSISWQAAQVYALPLGPSALAIKAEGPALALAHEVKIPLLGGSLHIDAFEWAGIGEGKPAIQLQGRVEAISLEKLSRALDWPSLAGEVSGRVPSASYQRGELKLAGKMKVQVFDGEVSIENLTVADLFGVYPRLGADVLFHDLDLARLTERFAFGKMEGCLQGRVKALYLEDWRPVSFDAWFGTPKGDTSRHRISQKAVENLTSLSGGPVGLLSRGFMRFFDSFSYDRFAIGCRLQQGVCELSGIGNVDSGYYIVKGGGLPPRIDVIGYNRRVDWNVLLQRLSRITAVD